MTQARSGDPTHASERNQGPARSELRADAEVPWPRPAADARAAMTPGSAWKAAAGGPHAGERRGVSHDLGPPVVSTHRAEPATV